MKTAGPRPGAAGWCGKAWAGSQNTPWRSKPSSSSRGWPYTCSAAVCPRIRWGHTTARQRCVLSGVSSYPGWKSGLEAGGGAQPARGRRRLIRRADSEEMTGRAEQVTGRAERAARRPRATSGAVRRERTTRQRG